MGFFYSGFHKPSGQNIKNKRIMMKILTGRSARGNMDTEAKIAVQIKAREMRVRVYGRGHMKYENSFHRTENIPIKY
ncbi:conserved Plasmodium protein, unknown function [Plasmodium ovale curtisi]|uniref:Uncharacterized protein n=1 Tax=Plasmodium ovale curtisi TaxID=864141 RepID=A0A1A8WYL6_PLAOA|nr:conserved Plasmodium protein, unknown function [Plasmodium ovale curtisi]SBS98059.1 conserved Plasmodium protein, unknown function [Plasmodium ovale curtisi]